MYRTNGYPVDLGARARARAHRRARRGCSSIWSLAARWLTG
jgi:hypothetical protein